MRLLFANWKLYLSVGASVRLARSMRVPDGDIRLALFPSALALPAVARSRRRSVLLGSQNIAPAGQKAATGEMDGLDLHRLGCRYVLVGHSERRRLGESDATVRAKLAAAVSAELVPVLCVGETTRTSLAQAQRFVRTQIATDLRGWKGKTLCIAYEPVWAISRAGKGRSCPPDQAFAMAQCIQKQIKRFVPKVRTAILYGGSVKGSNIADFVDGETLHGALVGHASTERSELAAMLRALA